MIKVDTSTLKSVRKSFYNKNNSEVRILFKKTEGATELSRMFLGKTRKERQAAFKLLTGSIPEGCGEKFCIFCN